MKLKSLLQLVDKLQQACDIDKRQQAGTIDNSLATSLSNARLNSIRIKAFFNRKIFFYLENTPVASTIKLTNIEWSEKLTNSKSKEYISLASQLVTEVDNVLHCARYPSRFFLSVVKSFFAIDIVLTKIV